MPGDILDPWASAFGFTPRFASSGLGDGNSIVEGHCSFCGPRTVASGFQFGEPWVFWRDLSDAKLIKESFSTATNNTGIPIIPALTGDAMTALLPKAKLGGGQYVFVYESGGKNYYGITKPFQLEGIQIYGYAGMTVLQAYSLDNKVDDGFPQTGKVIAQHVLSYGTFVTWARWADWAGDAPGSASTYDTLKCYHNNNVLGAQMIYATVNLEGVNCALSFEW